MTPLLATMAWNALEAAIAAGVIAILCAVGKFRAPLRHALWVLVLLKLLVPPVALHRLGLSEGCRAAAREVAAAVERLGAAATEAVGEGEGEETGCRPPHGEDLAGDETWFARTPGMAPPTRTTVHPAVDLSSIVRGTLREEDTLAASGAPAFLPAIGASPPADAPLPASDPRSVSSHPAVEPLAAGDLAIRLAAWIALAGSGVVLARRLREALALRAILRAAEPAPARVAAVCRELAARLGIRRPPAVRVLPDPASPFLAALGPPVVVIPRSLYSLPPGGCGGGALEAVLAHELAHLRRGDRGAAWLECTASIAFWWFPLLPLVRAELHRAADEAADAGAAAALGSPRRYAASLVEALDVLTTEPPPAVCPGLGLGERQAIERRLTMILRQPLAAGLDWKCRLAVLVLGLFILPAAAERARGQTISAAPATAATSDDRDPGAAADVPGESAIAAEPGEPAIAAEPETPPAPAGGARAASSSADAADDYGIGAGGPRPARRRATARTAPGAAAAPAATARSRGVTAAGGMAGMPRLDEVYERLERLSAELADLRAALGRPGVYGEAGQTLPPPMSPKADPNVPQDGWRVYRQLDPGSQLPGERGKSLDRWLKQLDLNEDQRRKFEELEKDHEARMKEFHQKMADLEDRHQAAIQELLTPEQREALERSRRQYRNGENPWPAAPAAPGPGGPARPRPGYGARAPIAPPGLGPRALPEPQPVEPRAKN